MRRLLRALVLGGALLASTVANPARAQVFDDQFWQTDGTVRALLRIDDTLYVGGEFSNVGPYTGGATAIPTANGVPVLQFPRVEGDVFAVIDDGNGGCYLGGNFTKIGGISRNGLAHLDANLTVTNWNPNPNGVVRALARAGNTVYVGGSFSVVAGVTRINLAALDGTTGAALAWNPGANSTVYVLEVHTHQVTCPDGFCGVTLVYAGGAFTSIGGQPRNFLAALDPTTGAVNTWNPNPNGAVNAIDAVGATQLRVYVGGFFTSIAGQPRNFLASLTVAGAATTWNPNAGGSVNSIFVSGATIYVGGAFTLMGGQARLRIAAVDGTGAATSWNPGANDVVEDVLVDGSTVYVAGSFTTIGGLTRRRIAAVDASTATPSTWDPSADGTVRALALTGSILYAGGSFTSIGQLARRNGAAFDLTSGLPTAWGPDPDGAVLTLATDGSSIYAGGSFANVYGQSRNALAALDPASGVPSAWNPSPNAPVRKLHHESGLLYVGGDFDQIGGQPRRSLAAVDLATGDVTPWWPEVSLGPNAAQVYDLVVQGSTLYVCGNMNTIGSDPRLGIGAIDVVTGAPTSWQANSNGYVYALVADGSQLYAGGFFTAIGGQSRTHLAALSLTSAQATAWNPTTNGTVLELALNGTRVYAGGDFTAAGGLGFVQHLAEIDVFTGAVSSLDGIGNIWFGANQSVHALEPSGTTLFAGGAFSTLGSRPRRNLAVMTVPYDVVCDIVESPSWSSCGTPLASVGTGIAWIQRTATDGAGGAYVAWYDQTPGQVSVQRILSDGSIASGWPSGGIVVSPDSTTGVPSVVEDGSGGVFVAWRGWNDGLLQTWVQRLSSDGSIAIGWPASGLSVPGLPVSPFSGGETRAATDGAGGLFVTTNESIQRIDGAGNLAPGWSASGVQLNDAVELFIADGMGGAYFVTLALAEFGRLDAAGTVVWQGAYPPPFLFLDSGSLKIVADEIGGFYFAANSGSEVRLQHMTDQGAVVPGWSFEGLLLASTGSINDLVLDGSGGVYVGWSEANAPYTIHVQRVTPAGTVHAGWPAGGVAVGALGQNQSLGGLVSDGDSGVFVSWLGWNSIDSTALWATRLCGYATAAPGWQLTGDMVCPDPGYYTLGGGGVANRGLLADGNGGAFVPWFRRDGSPGWSGDISLLRLGSEPPTVGMAMVPVGSPSQASLDGVSLGFDTVSTAGELIVTRIAGPTLPGGLQTVPATGSAAYDISTTATYSGSIEVCIDYDPADVAGSESALTLLHYDGSGGSPGWVDITTNVDTASHRICGTTTSLSPFAIVENVATHVDAPVARFTLDQNHPNPFNPRTTIRFQVGARGPVQLSVYDTRGRLVRMLVEGVHEPGNYDVVWTGEDARGQRVASGVYFYRLTTPHETLVRRMALVR